jgi:NADPH:quinone reductase-like Zn-dependent oxidoreductase
MKITVQRSAVIDAPIDRVWEILRDFNSHHKWHPAVIHSQMENDLVGDVVGGVRRSNLNNATELREQLLSHSDVEHTYTYCILDSPLPLFDYLATVRLRPVTDGSQTFWDWRSQFRTTPERAEELKRLVGKEICESGITGLRTFLAEKSEPEKVSIIEEAKKVVTAVKGENIPSKAIIVEAFGGPEVMDLRDATIPAPEPWQVRIRQTAIGINYIDIKHRQGSAAGLDLPGTPGVEGVGTIIDLGEQVSGFFPGDRVAYVSRTPGAYADIRCVDADDCLLLPDNVSDTDASTFLKGVTTILLLNRIFRAASRNTIMIQSVSGGLGHILSQWAQSINLTVIGTVSTTEKAKFSRNYGCEYPIVTKGDAPIKDEVMRITNGRGVDYWVQSSNAHGIDDAVACLSRCGHCAVIGDRDEPAVPIDVNELKKRSITVSAPVCFDYIDDRSYLQRLAQQLFSKIRNRTISPVIKTFPLSQAKEAHKNIETRQNMGAIVLIPGE